MANGPLRSPLGRALGLGSAKEGVEHWWLQRVTAVALVPLSLWFVAGLIGHLGGDRDVVAAWLRSPLVSAGVVLLVISTFAHMALGVQVVIEDYVHHEGAKLASILVVKFAAWALAAAAVIAVLRVAFGG